MTDSDSENVSQEEPEKKSIPAAVSSASKGNNVVEEVSSEGTVSESEEDQTNLAPLVSHARPKPSKDDSDSEESEEEEE